MADVVFLEVPLFLGLWKHYVSTTQKDAISSLLTWFEEPVKKELIIIYSNTDLLGATVSPSAVQAVVSTSRRETSAP